MGPNTIKQALKDGRTVLGAFVAFDAPGLVELFGYCGFDFIVLDAEHGPLDPHHIEGLTRACEIAGVTAIVRVPENNPRVILRYMDVGPQGVLIPWCQSAEEARSAVQAVKYYPEGTRGLAGVRPAGYGARMPLTEYVPRANAETMVIVQIETIAAVEALPEILAVPGVDVFFIGPNDLSQSLGYPARPDEPVVQAAIERAIAEILDAGKTAAIMVRNAAELKRYRDRGVRLLTISATGLISPAARAFVAAGKE